MSAIAAAARGIVGQVHRRQPLAAAVRAALVEDLTGSLSALALTVLLGRPVDPADADTLDLYRALSLYRDGRYPPGELARAIDRWLTARGLPCPDPDPAIHFGSSTDAAAGNAEEAGLRLAGNAEEAGLRLAGDAEEASLRLAGLA